MNQIFKKEEIESLLNCKFEGFNNISFCIDSRELKDSQIFIPLEGEKFDGHDFINEILDKNKNSYSICNIEKKEKVNNKFLNRMILVNEKTIDIYHKITNLYLKKKSVIIVAITGSSGKTSTKELISKVLSEKYRVYKTQKNNNNEFGVPKTIFEMPEKTEVLILELAMRGRGEISQLSKICEPDICVINNIGNAHIGRLGSEEEIARAKLEILDYAKKDSLFIYHSTDLLELEIINKKYKGEKEKYFLEEVKNIEFFDGKTKFEYKNDSFVVNAPGQIHVLNSIAAILVAKKLKLNNEDIKKGLLKYEIPQGRGKIVKVFQDQYMIDETYNANPESVKETITNLSECWDSTFEKIVILGEMAELGDYKEELLIKLKKWIEGKKDISVITIGESYKDLKIGNNVNNKSACCDILKEKMDSGKKIAVLVKGSRITKMEEIIEEIKQWKEKK